MQEERETNAELRQGPGVSRPLAIEPEQAEREIAAQMPQNCEQKYRSLITNIPHVEWTTDCGGNTTFISPNVEKVCGYSPEEIYKQGDRRWFGRIHPDDVEKAKEAYKALFEKGTQFDIEYRIKKRDGQWIWLHDRSLVTYEKDGVMCADGIFCDVTERRQAEQQLELNRFLVESAHDAIFLKDLKSRYIIANKKTLEAFGLSSDEVIGKNDYEIMPNREEAKKNIEDDNLVFKTRKPTEVTKHMISTDGKERWFQAIKVPRFDDKGNIVGLAGIARDITEYKKVQEALKESEQKWRLLAENVPDVIMTIDQQGKILFLNRTVPPFTPDTAIGTSVYVYVPPEHQGTLRDALAKAVRTGEPCSYELAGAGPNGCTSWYRSRLGPIKRGGQVVALTLIATDVTERKETEDALRQSENKYRTLLENLPQKIFLKDTNSVYISCNENYASDLNIKSDEIAGKTDYDFYPRELAEKYRTDDQRILKSGQTTRIEEKYTQCGQDLIVETVKTPVRDEKGNVAGILGIFWDITQKKKAEDEIRKLSSAVEQSIDGVAIGDLEPRLVYVNEAFARMHGYSPEEMIGMRVARLHNREQMAAFKKRLDQIKTRGAWGGEIGHIRRDGTPFPTYVSVTLLNNDRGEPTGILAVTRDITESKQIKKELSAHREKMVRAEQLASLGTLSAALARELTQPLTVIRLSIENSLAELETIACPGNVIEDLKEGLSEVPTITSIVNRFRDFARRPSKKTLSEVDLKKVVEGVVRLLDESAWRAKVTLRVEGMDKLPLIYSYQKNLEQLIFALVENAIQAADGKKNRQVIISGAARDEHVELQFSDNCRGIAQEDLDRVFEPFFTTRTADERRGLRLCGVKRIVSRIGGKVRVESRPGKGSAFFVTLPTNRG